MSTRILLAPGGADKTDAALRHVARVARDTPFAKIWTLLPSKRQEDAFRGRLATTGSEQAVYFHIESFNFYELYQRVLNTAGYPYRHIGENTRLQILHDIVSAERQSLRYFSPIADKPGFVPTVADLIVELKQNHVSPHNLARAAQSEKDLDLARIYVAYQHFLKQRDLADREGQGWLAVRVLKQDPSLLADLRLLIVDGFDQFTPVQSQLLAALSNRADETTLTLTTVTGREQTIGRRFARTLQTMQDAFEGDATVDVLAAPNDSSRHPDLRNLIDGIFQEDWKAPVSSGGVSFIETPAIVDEVREALRDVKRLLHGGVTPDDILIVVRDWERYHAHFVALSPQLDTPLAYQFGSPLAEAPVIKALLEALTLHETDFRRRDLLDALRSPYFDSPGINSEVIDVIDRLSALLLVVGGRDRWVSLADVAELASFESEDYDDTSDVATYDALFLRKLGEGLTDFIRRVTPPAFGTVAQYVDWIDRLIGPDPDINVDVDEASIETDHSLNIVARLRREFATDQRMDGDLAALQTLKRSLQRMVVTHDLVASLEQGDAPVIDWRTFIVRLRQSIQSTAIDASPSRIGRALVATASDARGLPHDYVFVMGLSEGLFPSKSGENPLHLDSERRDLSARGARLDSLADRNADDGLFYEMACLPRRRLILSRPTVRDGAPWIESPLWRAARDVFHDSDVLIERRRVAPGAVAAVDEAATRDEAAIAIVDALMRAPDQKTMMALKWLAQTAPVYWRNIADGRAIDAGRIAATRYDRYSGQLEDPALVDIAARRLGPSRVWSASQLNDYGACGFRFFAKRMLAIDAIEEPEEGMDNRQRGTLFHAILESIYRRLSEDGITISPENLNHALAVAEDSARDVFATAPQTIGFVADGLWEFEQSVIWRTLERLIRSDFAVGDDSPLTKRFGAGRRPVLVERAFGIEDDVSAYLDDSVGFIRIRGVIDRIDVVGGAAVVIDYKSGRGRIPLSAMADGRNIQMFLYAEAARHILANNNAFHDVAGGAYWHIPSSELSGVMRLADEKTQQAIDEARSNLARRVSQGRRGDFAVHPANMDNGKCVRYCEFHKLCRVDLSRNLNR